MGTGGLIGGVITSERQAREAKLRRQRRLCRWLAHDGLLADAALLFLPGVLDRSRPLGPQELGQVDDVVLEEYLVLFAGVRFAVGVGDA